MSMPNQRSVLTKDIQDTHLARALKLAANPMCFVNRGSNIVWCNNAYGELVGANPIDLIGAIPSAIAPKKSNSGMLIALWKDLMAGKTWFGGLTETDKQGGQIFLDAVITPLSVSDQGKPALFFVMVHDVTLRQIEYTQMKHLAHHDRLTGLANRGLFTTMVEKEVAHGRRHNTSAAVLFIDLDGFKGANDTFGHEAGDMVLCEVARILGGSVRETDTAARLGGDEFACLLTSVGPPENAYMVAEKIVGAIRRPMSVGENRIQIGASVGVAIFPEDGEDYKTLLASADESMYAAKNAGKNCWQRVSVARDARALWQQLSVPAVIPDA